MKIYITKLLPKANPSWNTDPQFWHIGIASRCLYLVLMFLTASSTWADKRIGIPALKDQPCPSLQVKHAKIPPLMNASVDDPAWQDASVIKALQLHRYPGAEKDVAGLKPVPTTVQVLWDIKWLYVRFECTDPEPFSFAKGHDQPHYRGDVAEVFVRPSGQTHCWFELQLSPANDTMDLMYTIPGDVTIKLNNNATLSDTTRQHLSNNIKWDLAQMKTATRQTATGWIAEFALPAWIFKATTNPPLQRKPTIDLQIGDELNINFVRYENTLDTSTGKRIFTPMTWSMLNWGQPHVSPMRLGQLVLMPY